VDVDHGQLVGRGLKDVAIVVALHERAPFVQAIRDVSGEWGFGFASPQPPVAWSSLACPPVAVPPRLPTFPMASAVMAGGA
jgi:hypothetical protein